MRLPWKKSDAATKSTELEAVALREFVYLDEVSVYSLYASQHGAVPEEYTATQSSTSKSNVEGKVGASVPTIGKAEVASGYERTRAAGTQVVSRSNIQATFKHLVEGRSATLPMAARVASAPPDLCQREHLIEVARSGGRPPWVIDPSELRRGQLLELEVDLEAEETYAAAATTASLIQMVSEIPELQVAIGQYAVSMTLALSRVLERLHAGLVPLRGTVKGYCVADLDGREWLIHETIADAVAADRLPLYLVGVAEEDLFWKDIRRVVFSRSRFTVMARLARDGLQTSWTPMKLLDVIKQAIPPLAEQLEAGPRSFLTAAREQAATQSPGHDNLRAALVEFATVVANDGGSEVSVQELEDADLLNVSEVDVDGPTARLRPLFQRISSYLAEHHDIRRDRVKEGLARDAALTHAGVGLLASAVSKTTGDHRDAGPPERILDTEFVAIYW